MVPMPLDECVIDDEHYVLAKVNSEETKVNSDGCFGYDGKEFRKWDFNAYMFGKLNELTEVHIDHMKNAYTTFRNIGRATNMITGRQTSLIAKAVGSMQTDFNSSVGTLYALT